jgi:hypothetical protein
MPVSIAGKFSTCIYLVEIVKLAVDKKLLHFVGYAKKGVAQNEVQAELVQLGKMQQLINKGVFIFMDHGK